jgi:hypothetical protein
MHERDAIDLRGLAIGAGVVVAGIAIAVAAPWLLIAPGFVAQDARSTVSAPQSAAPLANFADYRREKMRRLEESGVDPGTGKAHIPIERAMEILAGAKR